MSCPSLRSVQNWKLFSFVFPHLCLFITIPNMHWAWKLYDVNFCSSALGAHAFSFLWLSSINNLGLKWVSFLEHHALPLNSATAFCHFLWQPLQSYDRAKYQNPFSWKEKIHFFNTIAFHSPWWHYVKEKCIEGEGLILYVPGPT